MASHKNPIDAVITWADGNDKIEQVKREHYLQIAQAADGQLHENATNPHRWTDNGEIYLCLKSLHNNAPWLRTIWILTSSGGPDLGDLPEALTSKIRIITHAEVYTGYEDCLPTFNSLSIETLMWRIPGLSERFVYFNDDVFLSGTTHEDDFFDGSNPVLRGCWDDYSRFEGNEELKKSPVFFNHYMELHAAQMLGFEASHLFSNAHVAHPLVKSTMEKLANDFAGQTRENAAQRFRSLTQFQPVALHNHKRIRDGEVTFKTARDYFHLHSGVGADLIDAAKVELLDRAFASSVKLLCVNDLPQLGAMFPRVEQRILSAIGE